MGHLTLAECRVRGPLAASRLPDLHLSDAVVAGADLANLHAPTAALRRVTVDQARLTGATLSEASLRDVTLSGCRIDLASLAAARLERVVFADCDLRETSFGEAVLRDVRFERCDLGGADLARVRPSASCSPAAGSRGSTPSATCAARRCRGPTSSPTPGCSRRPPGSAPPRR